MDATPAFQSIEIRALSHIELYLYLYIGPQRTDPLPSLYIYMG